LQYSNLTPYILAACAVQMARLNEQLSAPTESIESRKSYTHRLSRNITNCSVVKRKFVRQNRDIARANSAQSLRIRNLENETSRLLAENLGLREQILHLQNELENGKAQKIADGTGVIKLQLEAKLLEIGALITGLGDGSAPKRRSPREGKITKASPSRSPDQRNWKNLCTLSEAVAGQEGRLPAILENKSYPRRTLELVVILCFLERSFKLTPSRSQEMVSLIVEAAVDTTDSPDIGPPPVSQFVDEDPVKIDLPIRPRKNEPEDISELDPALSVSIEQRRKRRDSSVGSESRGSSKTEAAPVSKEGTASLKTGAKRKFSVRDDDELGVVTKATESSLGDFKFTRVASEDKTKPMLLSQPERSGSKVARELAIARGESREKQSATAAPSSRKILASKSVNDSPKKGSRTQSDEELKATKGEVSKTKPVKDRQREKRHDPISIKPTPTDNPLPTVEVQPETPAGLDLFSPPSSQPSTARNESRDTPPPPDLGPGTEGQRPSRRARPAVSYAEPNLRDKMRRPTKELVDAVVAGTGSLRASTIKSESDDLASSVRIKSEPGANDSWKRMPVASSATVENSPLSGKVAIPEALPSSIITHRKRRESILAENDIPRTSSASAMAALLAGSRRLTGEAQEGRIESESAPSKPSSTHDIYDFRGSSPAPVEEAAVNSMKEEKPVSRFSRRHSSIARDIPPVYDSESSDLEGSKKSDLSKSRRRQSTLGLRSSSSASAESSKEEAAEKSLKKTSSTISMSDSGSIAARSDRISARRRSMML
jgi:hypothetical protein